MRGISKSLKVSYVFLLFGACLLVSGVTYGADKKKEKFPADAGKPFIPSSLRKDYPPEIEKGYKLTISNAKCAKCHTAARVLNTIMYSVNDWKRYVKRMMNKPKSNITNEEGKLIYHFLKYDQINRKEKHPENFYIPLKVERPAKVSWFDPNHKPINWK